MPRGCLPEGCLPRVAGVCLGSVCPGECLPRGVSAWRVSAQGGCLADTPWTERQTRVKILGSKSFIKWLSRESGERARAMF